jgi:ribosomal protein S27AE
VAREEAWKLANDWVAAWNAHNLDLILAQHEDGIDFPGCRATVGYLGWGGGWKTALESLLQARVGSVSGIALSSGGRAVGHKRRGSGVHKSQGDRHRGVHGTIGARKSGASGGELQRLQACSRASQQVFRCDELKLSRWTCGQCSAPVLMESGPALWSKGNSIPWSRCTSSGNPYNL